jgi:signal transduction histidine kinase/CheY-like chemotaxis protein
MDNGAECEGVTRWFCALLAGLAFLLVAAMPGGAWAADPIAVLPIAELDLSEQVDWCAAEPGLDVVAIAAGGCRFAPASSKALARGFSKQAFWVRLVLVNPAAEPVVRWLRVGHARLLRVSFFESVASGQWRRSDTGLSVPVINRPIFSIDPILPLTLAPGERRSLMIRVESTTFVDLNPTLWQPNAYAKSRGRIVVFQAASIGCLLVTALFTMMIYFQWKDLAYLYFAAGLFAKTVYLSTDTALLPTYLWPETLPFDIRLHSVAGFAIVLFFVLFIRRFVGTRPAYRWHHAFLLCLLFGGVIPATLWCWLVDYSAGIRSMLVLSLLMSICAIVLCWRAWRNGFRPAGFLMIAYVIFVASQLTYAFVAFGGGAYIDLISIINLWGFLMSSPAALFGIAVHKEEMQRQLLAAQAESAARVDFLARMSHELRTPLDTILGTAQLLSRAPGPPRQAEGLSTIRDSGWHLLRMIDDILNHARGLAGRFTLVPVQVDWPSFLRGIEANGRLLAARNGNTFLLRCTGAPLRTVRFDDGRVRQILDNLLSNATRHTRNGRIQVNCVPIWTDRPNQLLLHFEVIDTGEGIAPVDRDRIFLPFERGGRTTRQGGRGVGMGLAISRQLVELMGGRLTVESQLGMGACFRFQVMAEAEAARAVSGPSNDRPVPAAVLGGQHSVLLVEDEEDSRRILATLLSESGFVVHEASSGREAVEWCAMVDSVDVVMTDQFMDDGDGWMVLQTLSRLYPDLPVVLMSAAPPTPPAGFPAQLSFAAHLLKPLDHRRVVGCLGDLLGLGWDDKTEPEPAPVDEAPVPSSCRPDRAEIRVLREMIANGQMSAIMAWADELALREPRCAPFAKRAHAAAHQLDFPTLQALAEL